MKEKSLGVTYAKGFQASGVKAGIKKSGNLDLAVIYSETEATIAGVFTQNLVAAAPIQISKQVAAKGKGRAIVANAGCANACTGPQGLADAKKMAVATAAALGVGADEIVVASTGVIGVAMPMEKVEAGIGEAVKALCTDGSSIANQAILTTDTVEKAYTTEIEIGGKAVRIGGIAKGSGMIHPNMATMLSFITTDAAIDHALLQQALKQAIDVSFNMVSVDGDTSTNDMAVVMANGAAGNTPIAVQSEAYETFAAALKEVCVGLAKQVAFDGEGATKFLTVNVTGAVDFTDAKKVAMAVAKSPLVKTAFFGEDPNWGRVICAVGYAGAQMEPEKTKVLIGGIPVFDSGVGASGDGAALRKAMEAREIVIDIALHMGDAAATVWTCDFSYEYVKINGEYHT